MDPAAGTVQLRELLARGAEEISAGGGEAVGGEVAGERADGALGPAPAFGIVEVNRLRRLPGD